MNISIYRTAKSLEITEVKVYGCFIFCPCSLLRKTLILCNWRLYFKRASNNIIPYPYNKSFINFITYYLKKFNTFFVNFLGFFILSVI